MRENAPALETCRTRCLAAAAAPWRVVQRQQKHTCGQQQQQRKHLGAVGRSVVLPTQRAWCSCVPGRGGPRGVRGIPSTKVAPAGPRRHAARRHKTACNLSSGGMRGVQLVIGTRRRSSHSLTRPARMGGPRKAARSMHRGSRAAPFRPVPVRVEAVRAAGRKTTYV